MFDPKFPPCGTAFLGVRLDLETDPDSGPDIDDDEQEPLISPTEDVATAQNEVADSDALVRQKLPAHLFEKYEVYSYRGAAVILSEANRNELDDIVDALAQFTINTEIIRRAGGNETEIPKRISALLRPKGWNETIVQGDLKVRLRWKELNGYTRAGRARWKKCESESTRTNFLDGHKIDYVKNRVAFDLEWNSKDQTFDRDLYAFSAFAQCGVVNAGILLTRSAALNDVFRNIGPSLTKSGEIERKKNGNPRPTIEKYGASTTWMGKLLYRLNAGRNGACPVLALGILPTCVSDWVKNED